MFERYTETARRSIFFARCEASTLVSGCIEPEHLLLGLLREDRVLASRLPGNEIGAAIARTFPPAQSISTGIELPLSVSGKRVLTAAAEEATELNHRRIGTGHIMLGLLRDENSLASKLLRQNGVDRATMRELVTETTLDGIGHEAAIGNPSFIPEA